MMFDINNEDRPQQEDEGQGGPISEQRRGKEIDKKADCQGSDLHEGDAQAALLAAVGAAVAEEIVTEWVGSRAGGAGGPESA